MGVDYSAVGGIGIYFDDYYDLGIGNKVFTEEEYNEDTESTVSEVTRKLGAEYCEIGDAYSGETSYCIMVPGSNLLEVYTNANVFLSNFNKLFGKNINFTDLKVINELYVW